MPNAILIDTTRCTACRGCQIACKEWHDLPANATKQTGTHQNPPDLNAFNYKVVRFNEYINEAGKVVWNFFPDQCRHCLVPPCKDLADLSIEGAIIQDEKTGAVVATELSKQLSDDDFESIKEACPYNVPRRENGKAVLSKCTFCLDRQQAGMVPACVKSCPTGAMQFGTREEILAAAKARLAVVKKEFPKAFLADPDDVNVIYLLADDADKYHSHAVA